MEAEQQISGDGYHNYSDGSAEDYDDEEDDRRSLGWDDCDGPYTLYVFAIRKDLLHPVVNRLDRGTHLVGAWLHACQELPGVQGLADIRRLHPTALPSWLALDTTCQILPYLEIRDGNRVVFNNGLALDSHPRESEKYEQLKSFTRCRFQEGFASQGMLCSSPPLLLGVLDYLDAADLLNLSLVCKATHRASHYLFHLEEKVLKRRDIGAFELDPMYSSNITRHRAMRAASLMCGRPEALDVTCELPPGLLRNTVAAPDACTQPHASWTSGGLGGAREGLAEILEARRVEPMGVGWTVDPKGWSCREKKALARLRRRVQWHLKHGFDDRYHSDYVPAIRRAFP